jgi:ABC-type dipeptide/oligopeptide/nickel transport system permease component
MKRILFRLGAIWFAITLTFVMLRVLPGDAIIGPLIEAGADQQTIQEQQILLGLDQPIWTQYGAYLSDLIRGDLGESIVRGLPVSEILRPAFGSTVSLAFSALIVMIPMGITLGVIAARDHLLARLIIPFANAAPIYWTGTLVIFALRNTSEIWIPALLLAFHTSGAVARVTESSLRQTFNTTFVQTARAKGLRERTILGRHVLPMSLIPVITVIGLQAGFLLSGTILVEMLFLRPGIGQILVNGVLRRDYPVVQGAVMVITVIYVMINILVDLLIGWVDPRLRADV